MKIAQPVADQVQQVVENTAVAKQAEAPELGKAFDASGISIPQEAVAVEGDDSQYPFKLAFVAFDDCLVVDALPPQSRQGLSLQHQSLLEKILRSIGLQGGQGDVFLLPWPCSPVKPSIRGLPRHAVRYSIS